MRLIHSTTLALEEFMGQDIPEKFAILSHTWITGQEVSYKEYLEGAHREKSGYTKIVKACGLAKEQGIQYVWVDTCCIDKSSSAELSEAINSMYKWYEQSEVCYAFLSDLPMHGSLDYWLPRCRWFERGWTLQELIAPSYVIFFDAGYSIRGTKDSLQQILSEITNIDVDVLKGVRPISSYCIAAKMSWAHRRKTTRTEDIAYCLLGIFGLNMPLLYGEGNKAFRRLQEQLIRTSVDMSIFAWTLPRSTGHDSLVIHQSHYDENLVSPPRHEIMLCGMLAESPSEFLHCKDFITGAREPPFELSLTNVGIKILTRLYARNFPDCSVGYVLDLNCVALKQDINLGVRLRKVGYGQYLREEPWSLQAAEQRMGQAPAEKILLTEIPHKHLYHECRYVPCHKVLGKARRSVLHLHHNRHIGLGHGWPADRFDDEDEVFFTSYTTSYDFGIIKLMVKMQLRHLDGSIWDRYHECQVYVIGWSKRSSSEAVFGILNARQYATVLNAIKQIAHGEGSNSDGFHYLLHENNIPRANTVRFNEPDFRKDILVTFKASIEQDRDLCSNAFWRLRLLTRTCDKNEKTPA